MNKKFTINKKNIIYYILGAFILSLGVVLSINSGLGAGAWDCVNAHLGELIHISLGLGSILITTILIILIIILNKDYRYIIMAFPNYGVSVTLDFWDILVFGNINITGIMTYISFSLGLLLIPLGLSLLVASTFPAGVFDELVIYIMKKRKSDNFILYKSLIEVFAIILSIIIGLTAGIRFSLTSFSFGVISIGTLFITLTVGPLMGIYIKLFNRKDEKIENE